METCLRVLSGVLLFFFGAAVYSFLNVIIFRLPRGMDFVRGHSICPACERRLEWFELVPVVSWLCLRGKCRTCGARIPLRDTLVECFGGGIALLLAAAYGLTPVLPTAFAFFAVLTVAALIDADTMEIPNGCSICLLALAAVSVFTMPGTGLLARLIGAVCVSVPMLLLAYFIDGAFGGGDIKLMAAAGLFLGWRLTLASFFLALLLGGLWSVYLLAKKKADKKTHFSFGPCLCLGMGAALLWGERLIALYLGLFGL